MTHTRNVAGMLSSPRCCARTRAGTPCQNPAVRGKTRCRMHGGARGSGAPKGNTNALRSGLFTADKRAEAKRISQLIREARVTLRALDKT